VAQLLIVAELFDPSGAAMSDCIGPCIEWTGYRQSNGYGKVGVDGRITYAHRLAWERANGPIPDGMWVLHRCDNRGCVNPDHLFIGTRRDNTDDMLAKGRSCRGTRQHLAKLTDDAVREIRRLNSEGVSQMELARRYGVHQGTIWPILRRKTWRHVE
jgi:hypothetical protein